MNQLNELVSDDVARDIKAALFDAVHGTMKPDKLADEIGGLYLDYICNGATHPDDKASSTNSPRLRGFLVGWALCQAYNDARVAEENKNVKHWPTVGREYTLRPKNDNEYVGRFVLIRIDEVTFEAGEQTPDDPCVLRSVDDPRVEIRASFDDLEELTSGERFMEQWRSVESMTAEQWDKAMAIGRPPKLES